MAEAVPVEVAEVAEAAEAAEVAKVAEVAGVARRVLLEQKDAMGCRLAEVCREKVRLRMEAEKRSEEAAEEPWERGREPSVLLLMARSRWKGGREP